uniref:Acetolactate synthase large subunit n=1 Tax=Heterosigma akashiwo TaxID=2829 RepID=A0A224AFZ0_HETAK|nr:acetolactate synthase large subunit [Heterosigma akashiwo]BBA18290.1 acetolactate synthase large subunit [Heterosigma akashiwo]BBA18429.1 acetolactate synthase large subunit [Heterosigma akashiwo]BBA18571.1 acetolactate synthase large subunit [Heterosigma akashiwo]BBA18706.1 acetolactate synthase large subunit [Heterosigma akashiwo]
MRQPHVQLLVHVLLKYVELNLAFPKHAIHHKSVKSLHPDIQKYVEFRFLLNHLSKQNFHLLDEALLFPFN